MLSDNKMLSADNNMLSAYNILSDNILLADKMLSAMSCPWILWAGFVGV
jgi:hypothetical protein